MNVILNIFLFKKIKVPTIHIFYLKIKYNTDYRVSIFLSYGDVAARKTGALFLPSLGVNGEICMKTRTMWQVVRSALKKDNKE